MGLFSFLGGVAGRVAGVETIKSGGRVVKDLGKGISLPLCPKCNVGRLSKKELEVDAVKQQVRACNECDYVEPLKGPGENEYAQLQQHAMQRLQEMGDDERKAIMRTHKLSSRFFYAVSVLIFVYAIYVLFFGSRLGMLLPINGFALLFLVFGIKSSYRYWQVNTQTFFQPGSFMRWLKQGNWIV